MAYVEDLIRNSMAQADQQQYTSANWVGLPKGAAYSSFYPEWEVTTPQYQTPNPYQLAQMGYRTNELVFTCINVRADSIGEAPLQLFDNGGETPEEDKYHKLIELLKNPTPGLSEQIFWKITETYLGIAGFSAWEKERNNRGEVIRLWPMRPDWCSFMRGQQRPIRAIRYQPYGLPPMDIDVNDVLFFQYFDPLYPLLKPYSPTMNALEMVNTDNNMTLMVNNFIRNGNFLGGVLSTENQVLQEAEAEVYKRRWRDTHGGPEHAGEIAVMGKGLKFQTTSNTFRDMVFPEVDARSESRITMVFRVPPMLIGAKVGLDRSTYSNYQEARKGFYEGPMTSEWRFLSSNVADQLLPDFESEPARWFCAFDMGDVKALQEDRTAKVDRAEKMWNDNLATLDEARGEAGLDPAAKDGDKYKRELEGINPLKDNLDKTGKPAPFGKEQPEEEEPEEEKTQEQQDLEDSEEKKFRTYAKKRIKERQFDQIREYEFKYLPLPVIEKLVREYEGQAVIEQLRMVVVA